MAFKQELFCGDHNKTEKNNDEDPRLKKWKSWMEQRQEMCSKIAKTVKIKPEQVLMNTAEELSCVNEDKLVLEYTQITTDFDKYRGNPAWWKLPHGLKDKCHKKVNSGHYWVETYAQRNQIPKLEHVGVPFLVQQEKHILPRTRNMYTAWQNLEYRKLKMDQCVSKIESIRPHQPVFENLIVTGKGIFTQQSEPSIDTEIYEETFIKNLVFDENCYAEEKQARLAVSINGILLTESNKEVGSRKLRLHFDYDVSLDQIQTQYLSFTNSGAVTIRICWEKKRKFKLFRDFVAEERHKYGFFFDINDLVLVPGQTVEFPVMFKINKTGRYCENWEITFKPFLWNDDFHLFLVLQSYAYCQDFKEKNQKILEMIEIKTKTNLIREILDEITSTLKYPEALISPCEFDEARLFGVINLVGGRPRYLFDSLITEQLHKFYDKVKQEKHEKNWNFSVKHLERVAQEKDVLVYLGNRKNREIFPKTETPGSEGIVGEKTKGKNKDDSKKKSKTTKEKGSKSSNKKKKGKKEIKKVDEIKEIGYVYEQEFYIYSNQEELESLLSKLEKPIVTNFDRLKYFCATQAFSAYFTKMCHLLEDLGVEIGMRNNVYYPDHMTSIVPIDFQHNHLIYERFDDTYGPKLIPLKNSYTITPKNKPKTLQEIPPDDLETIYLTYFNKSRSCLVKKNEKQVEGKKGKGKKGANKKSKKGSSDKKSKKGSSNKKSKNGSKKGKDKSKVITVHKQESVELFDPYAEEFNYVATTESGGKELSCQSSTISSEMLQNYDNNCYIIVYSCLVEAVEALVDAVDSFSCVVSYETLEEVKKWFPK